MEAFIRRVADHVGRRVVNEGELHGIVPFYSGEKNTQSFALLEGEIRKHAAFNAPQAAPAMDIKGGGKDKGKGKGYHPAWNGRDAPLNEDGYQAVAWLKNGIEMEAFIRRVADHVGRR